MQKRNFFRVIFRYFADINVGIPNPYCSRTQEGLATMLTSDFDPAGRRVLQHDMLDERIDSYTPCQLAAGRSALFVDSKPLP